MKKIEKLDKKQIALMETVKQEWLDRLFSCKNTTNRKQATEYIEWLYSLANLKTPKVIFLDSPLGIQYGANLLKKVGLAQVWDQVRAQVGDQVRAQVRDQVGAQVRDQVGAQVGAQVWDQVRDQVRAQVWDQVGDQVGDQVRAQVGDQVRAQVGDQKLETFSTGYYGDIWDYGWISFYDFFQRIGIKYKKDTLERFNNFLFLMKSNIYEMIKFENYCIVSDMPTIIKRDERNRLHSEDSSAIEFKDGYKLFFYHGVAIKNTKIILEPEKLTKKDWLDEKNLEIRRVIQERMGDSFVKKIDGKKIQKDKYGQLIEIDLGNDPEKVAKYVHVKDSSTAREYYLRCHSELRPLLFDGSFGEPQEQTARNAVASTFGMRGEDYHPDYES